MMKLNIRAHDLGVRGEENILARLDELGLSGVQLVAYKCLDDVEYAEGSMTKERAQLLHSAFEKAGRKVPLIGAYFNPVHPDKAKAEKGKAISRSILLLPRTWGVT